LFFDLDGTLSDSREGVVRCIQHALEHVGAAAPPAGELTWCVGPALAGSFQTLLGTSDEAVIDRALAAYRARYERIGICENALYPGVVDAIVELAAAGHYLSVVTVKPHVYARRVLERDALTGPFRRVYGPELHERHGTKAALIGRACAGERADPARTMMIGDRAEDVTGAHQNGIRSVAVTWGYGERAELEAAHPHHIVSSVEELLDHVRMVESLMTGAAGLAE
jgi:phosphoglycolate phosphatase